MKKYVLLFLGLLSVLVNLSAQSTTLRGQLYNYKSDYELRLSISNSTIQIDSVLKVSATGIFSIEMQQFILEPTFVSISLRDEDRKPLLFKDLFFVPNDHLVLDATIYNSDTRASNKSITIGGNGAHLSQLYDSKESGSDTVNWIQKDLKTYIHYLNQIAWSSTNNRLDSLLSITADSPYTEEWKRIFALEQDYTNLNSLIANYGFNNDLPADTIQLYLKELGFTDFWNQLDQETNLRSKSFRYFIRQLSFLERSKLLKYPDDVYQQFQHQSQAQLHMLDHLFTGKVRDVVLNDVISKLIANTHNLEKIDTLRNYIPWVINPMYRNRLVQLANQREEVIGRLAPGSPVAKKIKIKNSHTHDIIELSDLKGKVVFIESWASWCGPCKEEVPYIKKLVEYYKDNPHIMFVSLAVFEDKEEQIKSRLKFVQDNYMDWLQLEDIGRNFTDYFKIEAIPHNVILDKDGCIVDNDSIRPSSPDIITYLDKILKEL